MRLFGGVQQETAAAREQVFSAPIIAKAMTGDITTELYINFLTQA